MPRSRPPVPRISAPGVRPAAAVQPAPSPGSPWTDALLLLLVVTVVVALFYRATGYFFRADDFEGLARARGLLPARTGLARLIPWRLYFEIFDRWFGLDPWPYHLASLTALASAAGLVFAWLRAPAGRWAALAGAACFASHPAHYASVYWISAIGDPLAVAFALGALLSIRSASRGRWAAVPLFALALVSKETALLVPAVAFLDPGRAPALPRARRDPLPWALAGMSVAMVAYYLVADPIGTRHTGGEAYVPRLGGHLLANLLTYAGWTVNVPIATLLTISDAVEPGAFPTGIALIALGLLGLAWTPLRRAGWAAGGMLWIAMLAPVLPLAHHTYRYYLTGPLAGAAMMLAALAAVVGRGSWPGANRFAAPAAALALAAVAAWNGDAVVRRIEFSPFTLPGSRADAVVDRALIAARVAEGLEATPPPAGSTLRFWSPNARQISGLPDSSDALGYWERNVSASVLDGLGVRVLFPQVRRVEFVPRFTPGGDTLWYAVYGPDGALRAGSAADIGRALAAIRAR